MFTASVLKTHAYGIEIHPYTSNYNSVYNMKLQEKPDSAKPAVFVHTVAFLNQVYG